MGEPTRDAYLADDCESNVGAATARDGREQLPKRWQVMALAQRLWEQHGHPGETCEPGSKGLGSCALDEARHG